MTPSSFWSAHVSAREARLFSVCIVAVFALLVFARLGHAALWDDEADTALFGQAVWATGDTAAVHGANLVLYRDGVSVDATLHNRLVAPLPYFIDAVFVRDTQSAWWARGPFALAGLATVMLLLRWLAETAASRRTWALAALALLGNVSWILYARQARYYTLGMLLATLVVYAYAHRARSARWLVVLALAGAALCATHYLAYAGVAVALAVDYVVWGRGSEPLSRRRIGLVIASQVVLCAPIVLVWYPLGHDIAQVHRDIPASERVFLWLRTLRDMNACEYGAGLLVLIAPLLARRAQDSLLSRLPLAILIASAIVTVFSPQPADGRVADVRYVAFLIPACVLVGLRVIEALPLRHGLAIWVGAIAFQTTALQLPIARVFTTPGYHVPTRCTLATYLGELADPPPSAYRLVADWLGEHATPGESALVFPDFAAYPLMFHAPHVQYAWQLTEKRAASFPGIAPIHIAGRVPPDLIVTFDPRGVNPQVLAHLRARGANYTLVGGVPATGIDASRAELFWHRFRSADAFAPEAPITIWRRAQAPEQ